jgi:lipooligosaccharide transport system permease protein
VSTIAASARPSPLPVFGHRWVLYLRTWRGSVLSSFLLPVMFLVGMGVSVGSYVDETATLGVDYLDFIAPGLLASTAFQVAVSESTYPVLAGFLWVRNYHAMLASPLRPRDMVGGEILWVGFRVGTSALGFLVVMMAFGVVHSPWAVLLVPIALLLGVAVCAPVLGYAATVRQDSMFALLMRFVVIPTTLFAGVFFPVEQLPALVRWVAYVTPLWHGVELSRAAALGAAPAWPWAWHLAYLAAWGAAGYLVASRQFARRLVN